MAQFIDRRLNGKKKSTVNRQRFIRRHKDQIKRAVSDAVNQRSVTNTESGESISIPKGDISEPVFHQGQGGIRERVLPGNDQFIKGDKLNVLKEEMVAEVLVMEMPVRMAKVKTTLFFKFRKMNTLIFFLKSLNCLTLRKTKFKITEWETHRAGYQTAGVPSNIDIVRSLQQSLARRTAMTAGKNDYSPN